MNRRGFLKSIVIAVTGAIVRPRLPAIEVAEAAPVEKTSGYLGHRSPCILDNLGASLSRDEFADKHAQYIAELAEAGDQVTAHLETISEIYTANDGVTWKSASVYGPSHTYFVALGNPVGGNGTSPEGAFSCLADALAACDDDSDDVIWVIGGPT